MDWLVKLTELLENVAAVAAIGVAGVSAYMRYVENREGETALAIDLQHTAAPYDGGTCLVSFDVRIENKGKVKLTAKPNRCPAFEDSAETLRYSGDLLLRPVARGLAAGSQIGWFDQALARSPRQTDLEFDLLAEYENDGFTHFWLEPNETSHLSAAAVLVPGSYLAMVTFVGDRSDDDLWRRVFVVPVPQVPDEQDAR